MPENTFKKSWLELPHGGVIPVKKKSLFDDFFYLLRDVLKTWDQCSQKAIGPIGKLKF